MAPQHTVGASFQLGGVGLHTGAQVLARVRRAPDGHGLRVVRVDLPGCEPVPWMEQHVQDTFLATSVGTEAWTVATAEHLVAALAGLRVDNALIEVDGPEVPVLDGSSAGWVAALRAVGRAPGKAPRRVVAPREVVEVRDGEAWARLEPAAAPELELELDVSVAFAHPAIGAQVLCIRPTPDRFESELSWARTFGFVQDVQRLRAAGRARGGSLKNAVVFGPDGPLNPGGLRSPDEVVRHKTLDLVGDLALIGSALGARVVAHRPGHALTRALVRAARPLLRPVPTTA
jgi:UDP-3-O-[3-hydroxymyristoyl] N-acetylglucosamine deacetylase